MSSNVYTPRFRRINTFLVQQWAYTSKRNESITSLPMLPTFLVSILISYINGKCADMKQKFDKILGKLVLSVRESPMVDGQLPLGQTPPPWTKVP